MRLASQGKLLTSFGLGLLSGLRSDGLIDLKESHFEFAEKIEKEGVFLRG